MVSSFLFPMTRHTGQIISVSSTWSATEVYFFVKIEPFLFLCCCPYQKSVFLRLAYLIIEEACLEFKNLNKSIFTFCFSFLHLKQFFLDCFANHLIIILTISNFDRDQFEHLTGILHSRILDSDLPKPDKKLVEMTVPLPAKDIESSRPHDDITTPANVQAVWKPNTFQHSIFSLCQMQLG